MPDRPDLSVVVTAAPGADPHATLAALRSQTLDAARFEVLLAGRDPAPDVRHVPTDATVPFAGLAAAAGRFVTFVDAGDVLARATLEALLDAAGDDVLVGAHVITAADRSGPADLRYGAAATLRPHPTADAAAVALGRVVGLLFPTGALRDAVSADPGADPAITVARAGEGRRLVLAPPDAGAFYVRHVADAPVSADRALRTVSVLAGLPGSADSPIRQGLVDAGTDALNRVLRDEPARHDEVVARLRDLPLVDRARLNRDLARDLAIVYAALPYVDTSGNIAARRLRALGRPVDVVCADLSARAAVDPTASALWQDLLGDRHELPGPITLEGEWGPVAGFCRRGLEVIARAEAAKGPYRSVYSRTMFPAAQLLGALHKIRHPGTPWLAEFSDPQQRDSRGGTRRSAPTNDPAVGAVVAELRDAVAAAGFVPPTDASVWEWGEMAAYALADTVLFTNEHQRDYMLGYCADPAYAARARAHAVVEHHPQPPAELYRGAAPQLDPALVHLGYFGTFYPTRSITEVVEAIGRLAPGTRARLRLHVFTKYPERLQVPGLEDVVVVNGYLQFADYLAMTTRMDALVVNDYATAGRHDVNPYLPAKYADYAGSGRPVWGLVEPGSVLDSLPLAHRSVLGDVAGAQAVLERLAAR